MTGGDAVNNLC